ncbi:MAG: amino acid ABC transporter permease [Acidisphaera sp.]|nr:amino acid ABC transporter permease [Acidisphaera sp.]
MWNWTTFFHYLQSFYLVRGALVTLGLSVAAMLLGLVCGLVAALMRLSSNRFASGPARFYIWAMRGTPVLVQLIVIYTGLPQFGLRLDVLSSAILGLGLNEGAYLAEIFRAGILAVPKGQFEAAQALGLSRGRTMRLVVVPQALRIVVPPIGNTFNSLMKTSSLASVISMDELLRRTEMLIQAQFRVLEIFSVAALYYLLLTTLWGFVQRWIEQRLARAEAPGRDAVHETDALTLSQDSA